MTPATPVRPFVLDLVRAAGETVSSTDLLLLEGDLTNLLVDDAQGTLAVRDSAGLLEIRLLTRDPRVVETFLVLRVADGWRQGHSRRPLGDGSLRPARTHEVLVQADATATVRRRSDGAVVAWRLSPADARRLASALDHPVETVVAAVQEDRGRPVWTGSALWPVLWPVLLGAVILGGVATIQLRRHAGSPETVIGTGTGLLLCVVGAAWLVWRMKRGRRLTDAALDRARPGAPRWRCQVGPHFATEVAGLGFRGKAASRWEAEVTLVEAPDALELWRGGGDEPRLQVPWEQVASVDAEPVASSPACVLVVRTFGGGRVPVVLFREREGAHRGATTAITEQYAAHLRERYLSHR